MTLRRIGVLSHQQLKMFAAGTKAFSTGKCVNDHHKNTIPVQEVQRYMMNCMNTVGTPEAHSKALAEVLIAADYRGHFSHGLNRLEMYVNDITHKICDGAAKPVIVKENVSTGLVDGKNGLGPVAGNFSMQLAIKKAKNSGVGWVVANNSNHYGIAGWYSLQAVEAGLIGLSFTNTSPLQAPTRAKRPALGTNPITVAAPAKNGDIFFLDMATSAVAVGKIEIQRRKNEPIPEGWAMDHGGKVTADGRVAMEEGCLMPLGGTEIHSGYKGFGLAFMVELFCGILSGSDYGPKIRRWMDADRPANLGQCFIAVDPSCFAPGFEDRLQDMMDFCRNMEPDMTPLANPTNHVTEMRSHYAYYAPEHGRSRAVLNGGGSIYLFCGNMEPADPAKPVLVAGDPERMHMKKVDQEGGITYHPNQLSSSAALAERLGVQAMKPIH